MALVECKNVSVNYGSFEACKDVSFSIEKGDYLCVVGANGSGKSTIVKAILGLVKIKSGTINFNRKHTGYLHNKAIFKKIFRRA